MVLVYSILRAKTTDEADNFRANPKKDSFALYGSLVQNQQ